MVQPVAGDAAPDLEIIDFETSEPVRLSSTWAERPAVLVFQRYFGCPFCQLHVARLLEDHDRFAAAGVDITLVGHGDRDAVKLGKAFSDFRILFDPQMEAYRAYEVPRGSVSATGGPATWVPFARAHLKAGVAQRGRMGGDFLQLSGTFLVDTGGTVRLAYRGRNASDVPSNDLVLEAAGALKVSAVPAEIPRSR